MTDDNKSDELLITDLVSDPANPNKGTPAGQKLIKNSLQRLGAGRSVLLDKNNKLIGGNQTIEAAIAQGFTKVKVVETDGDTLVAVKRRDLDLDKDTKARELSIADNRSSEVGLSWDVDILRKTDVELSAMFTPVELDRLLNDGKNSRQPNTIDLQPPPKKVWILLGIPFDRFDKVQKNLSALEAEAEISVQSARD